MMNSPSSTTFTWKIKNFDLLARGIYSSDTFVAGGEKWCIRVYPSLWKPEYLSIYLYAVDCLNEVGIDIEYSLRVINQINRTESRSGRDFERFSVGFEESGFDPFILLSELHDPKSGFIVNDSCIFEAEVSRRTPLRPAKEETGRTPLRPAKEETGRTAWRFCKKFADWGLKSFIPLTELRDPNNGFIVNDTCIIEAEVTPPMLGDAEEETVVQASATQGFEIEEAEDLPMLVTNTRTSSIAPPPTNLPKPSSTLKNRSNIASTMLQVFMSEFESNPPTYDKFGKVMEDLRASMYGGNMGDIFEEWRPRILEIEALLGDIEDLEHECKDEEPLQDDLSKLVESLAQFGQASSQAEEKVATSLSMLDSKHQELKETQKRLSNLRLQMEELRLEMVPLLTSESNIQEYISSEVSAHAKAISEKEEADKEIKNLKQNKEDVMKNIEAIRDRTEAQRTAIAEKKALIQVCLSNPSLSTRVKESLTSFEWIACNTGVS